MTANKDLYVFTSGFPCNERTEPFLWDELPFMSKAFDNIYFLPQEGSSAIAALPSNCQIISFSKAEANTGLSFNELMLILKWVLSDLGTLSSKNLFFKLFRYNLALLKRTFILSKYYGDLIKKNSKNNKIYVYSYWCNDLACIASFITRKDPKIVSFSRAHGFDVFEDQTQFGFIPFRKLQLRYLNAVFSVSKKGQTHLQNSNKQYSNKIFFSYLGTKDPGTLSLKNDKHVLVSCAFLRRLKGVEFIPEVLMHIRSKVKWIHIGGGELIDEIKAQCKILPPNVEVELIGNRTPEQVIEFYKKNPVSLIISLSQSEGLPVSLMEAISFGIPIMATDVGGCKEIANERTGILIPKLFDRKKTANAIDTFLSSEKNSIKFREDVRAFWENTFSAQKNYSHFYQKVLELQ